MRTLLKKEHDYTSAMKVTARLTYEFFDYVASKLGLSGFQASWAQLEFLKLARHYEHGFMIVDFGNVLYPQYYHDRKHFPSAKQILMDNLDYFKKQAEKLLKERPCAHPEVRKHWKWIMSLGEKDEQV